MQSQHRQVQLSVQDYGGNKDVFLLRQIHRQHGDDPGVAKLKRYSQLFMSMEPEKITRQEIADFCDDLNSRAVTDLSQFQNDNPRIVVTRHAVRTQMNRKFVFMMANAMKKRLIMWSSIDSQPDKKPLPEDINAALVNMPGSKCDHLNGMHFYFDGIQYAFIDNDNPEVCLYDRYNVLFLLLCSTT